VLFAAWMTPPVSNAFTGRADAPVNDGHDGFVSADNADVPSPAAAHIH
jgi:hypothetical protein